MSAVIEATEPVITVEWENGVFVSNPIPVVSKAEAFAKLDEIMRNAEWPSSIHIVISENGVVTWAQMGTYIEVNR